MTQKTGKFHGVFYGYLSPNVIFLSISAFLLLRALFENVLSPINQKSEFKKKLSSASFGIYLIHIIFLKLLKNGFFGYQLSALHGNPIYSVPITALSCFFLSFATVFALQKIKYVKNIV